MHRSKPHHSVVSSIQLSDKFFGSLSFFPFWGTTLEIIRSQESFNQLMDALQSPPPQTPTWTGGLPAQGRRDRGAIASRCRSTSSHTCGGGIQPPTFERSPMCRSVRRPDHGPCGAGTGGGGTPPPGPSGWGVFDNPPARGRRMVATQVRVLGTKPRLRDTDVKRGTCLREVSSLAEERRTRRSHTSSWEYSSRMAAVYCVGSGPPSRGSIPIAMRGENTWEGAWTPNVG